MTRIAKWAALGAVITGLAAAPSAFAAGDAAAGKQVFRANCRACHSVDGGGGAGPDLSNLTKGAAGSDASFAYSPEFKDKVAKGLKWDDQTLDAFLKDPNSVVPGTQMPVATPGAQDRANLVAYLWTLKP
jgi:cytochrome c